MLEYNYIDEETGQRVPVSQMSTQLILECLEGVYIHNDDGISMTVEDVMKQLRLELFIRQNNLRGSS